jgi:hypothetical protein
VRCRDLRGLSSAHRLNLAHVHISILSRLTHVDGENPFGQDEIMRGEVWWEIECQ